MLTVHGRSKACKFAGKVDYDSIGEVVQSVDIPVIANGDIDSEFKAKQVISRTGASAIMIGRAAQGRPWLANQIDHYLRTGEIKKKPELAEIKNQLITHVVNLAVFYGEVMGPRIARKHVGWYWRGISCTGIDSGFIKQFNCLTDVADQIQAIEAAFVEIPIWSGRKGGNTDVKALVKANGELAA